ncbi:hypothetical protein O0L34_g19447 [Tuta absoluta]|nr:hypothetical protein O0L34_g19447 [Tuta absoluta]
MDSTRRSFYKGYANLKDERDKTVSKPSTSGSRTVGRKRKKVPQGREQEQNSPERLPKMQKVFEASTVGKTTDQTVTQLRRANTLDYESLGMKHSTNTMRSKVRVSSPSSSDKAMDHLAPPSPTAVHAVTPPPPDDALDRPASPSPTAVHAATPPPPDDALDRPASPSPTAVHAATPPPPDDALDRPASLSPTAVHAATPLPPDNALDRPASLSPTAVHAVIPPPPDDALDRPAAPLATVDHAATPPPPDDALARPASPSPTAVHAATPPPPDDALDRPAAPLATVVHAATPPPPDDATDEPKPYSLTTDKSLDNSFASSSQFNPHSLSSHVFNSGIESREQEIELCLQQIRADSNLVLKTFTVEIEEIVNKDNNMIQENSNNIKRKLRKSKENQQLTRYKHFDFLSDDETIEWSSSSWDEISGDNSEESHDSSQTSKSKKKKQKKQIKKASKRNPEKATENVVDMS